MNKRQRKKASVPMSKETLNLLCWVDRCLFPDAAIKLLVKGGLSNKEATMLVKGYRPGDLSILRLWQDYSVDERYADAIYQIVQDQLDALNKIEENVASLLAFEGNNEKD